MPEVRDDSGAAPRLAVINGLRGVAILGVIYHHLLANYLTPLWSSHLIQVGNYYLSPYSPLSNLWFGVNLFFLLSGFVLALPYVTGARRIASFADVRSFYVRRARRLLPLYYLCLAVALLVGTNSDFQSPAFIKEALLMATFTFTFTDHLFLPHYNVALWSLGVEFWFSLMFPFLLLLRIRVGSLALLVLALVLSYFVRAYAIHEWPGTPAYQLATKDGVFGRLDDFAVGMLLADLFVKKRLPGSAASVLCVLLGFSVLVASAVVWDNVVLTALPYKLAAVLNDSIILGFFLLTFGLLGRTPRFLHRLFSLWPLQLSGAMCYSLYLWHLLGTRQWQEPYYGPREVPMYVILVFVMSAITYRYIEFPKKPLRELFVSFPG